jgi:hypothetical protein
MKLRGMLALVILILCFSSPVVSQRDATVSLAETGYSVLPSFQSGKYNIVVAIVADNPYDDRFASHPAVRVTARDRQGIVLTTRDISSAGIPPKGRIAFCESISADDLPASVEFRSLDAHYESTIYKPSEFRPFDLIGMRSHEDVPGLIRITGEIKNPYPATTGVWITLLYRDAAGKLIGGHSNWQSEILAGDPTPFQFTVYSNELPPSVKKIDTVVFSHNNSQNSWRELLRQ